MAPRELRPGQVVTNPDWEGGQPVRVLTATRKGGWTSVRYQDVNAHHHARQDTVKRGTDITLISGDARRGGR